MMSYVYAGSNTKYNNIDDLLKLADLEIEAMKHDVRSYMNANAMIWGWKEPETPRDHIDLVAAVMVHSPYFKFQENHEFEHLLQVLRSERQLTPPFVTDEDKEAFGPAVQRAVDSSNKRRKNHKRSTSSSSSSSSSSTSWVAPVYDSYDSGGGTYSD